MNLEDLRGLPPVIDLWPTTANILDVSKPTVYRAAEKGDIPTIRIGNRRKVPTARLLVLLGIDPSDFHIEETGRVIPISKGRGTGT